ncbi:hypothetical protein T12_1436 [Trichinella patagoniensis]|uniref:Uncharacterized protein n=1 Tax=Trichinella patagoniensis TaxID=990121 RepID=A0A0V1A154_9BILA|nr:hypothetical protein T12_1436 [Trichinella patagoniensis]
MPCKSSIIFIPIQIFNETEKSKFQEADLAKVSDLSLMVETKCSKYYKINFEHHANKVPKITPSKQMCISRSTK